jgi:hypothetical protein
VILLPFFRTKNSCRDLNNTYIIQTSEEFSFDNKRILNLTMTSKGKPIEFAYRVRAGRKETINGEIL